VAERAIGSGGEETDDHDLIITDDLSLSALRSERNDPERLLRSSPHWVAQKHGPAAKLIRRPIAHRQESRGNKRSCQQSEF
jgi:hypothetical protein